MTNDDFFAWEQVFTALPDPAVILDASCEQVLCVNPLARELGLETGAVGERLVIDQTSLAKVEAHSSIHVPVVLTDQPYRRLMASVSAMEASRTLSGKTSTSTYLLVLRVGSDASSQINADQHEIAVELARAVGRGMKNTLQALLLANEQTGSHVHGMPHLVGSLRASLEAGESFVSAMSAFVGPGGPETKRSVALSGFVARLEPVLRHLVGPNLRLNLDANAADATVWAGESHLVHLLAGLLLAARETCIAEGVSRGIVLAVWQEDEKVGISVSLEGPRMRWEAGDEPGQQKLRAVVSILDMLGGRLLGDSHARGALFAVEMPQIARTPRGKSPAPAPRSGPSPAVFLSAQDRTVRAMFRVAAERSGATLDCGLGAPVSLFGRNRRHIAWIIDLETADTDNIASVLSVMLDERPGPLTVPIIILSRARTPAESEVPDLVVRVCARGALFLRKPITASRASEALDGLSLREADSPWYRLRLPT